MRLLAGLAAVIALIGVPTGAAIIDEGLGIIYGSDHAFSLKAPKGWVLDNESAAASGVHAVFYPKGGTWDSSVVVAYARTRPVTDKIATADAAADAVVADFRAKGSPKYHGKRVKEVKTDTGKVAVIYHFAGDQWGNFEAAAYLVEEKTINFVVMSSRDQKAFAAALPAFEQLVTSYLYLGDSPLSAKPSPPQADEFDKMLAKARKQAETDEGKAYEESFSKVFAQPMQQALRECAKAASGEGFTLRLVFVIDAAGKAGRISSPPGQEVSACVAEKMKGVQFPVPPQPDWLVAVSITVK